MIPNTNAILSSQPNYIPIVPELHLLKDQPDRDDGSGMQVHEMLTWATSRWSALNDALNHRRHELQTELMALGDFDSALDALIQWIMATQATLDAISVSRGDKKALEFELARTKVGDSFCYFYICTYYP